MGFDLKNKSLIVNNAADFPLAFFKKDAAGNYERQAGFDETAERLGITGFGQLQADRLKSALGAKGVEGAKHVKTLIVGDLTNVAAMVGGEIIVTTDVYSRTTVAEFHSAFNRYERRNSQVITIKSGDTAAKLAERIRSAFDVEEQLGYSPYVLGALSGSGFTFTAKEIGQEISITFKLDDKTSGNVPIAIFGSTDAYEGRGNYFLLNLERLQTPANTRPYNPDTSEHPISGALYNVYQVTFDLTREDIKGPDVVNQNLGGTYTWELWVRNTETAYIADLTKWLNANVAVRTMYTATTASAVIGAKEIATLDVTAGAATAGDVTVTLNGVATAVAVVGGDTTAQVAAKIRNKAYSGWTTSGSGASVVFQAEAIGPKTDATFAAGTTGVTATVTTDAQGSDAETASNYTAKATSPFTTGLV